MHFPCLVLQNSTRSINPEFLHANVPIIPTNLCVFLCFLQVPVAVPHPVPVAVPVPQPYPVVQTKTITVPVDRPVPVSVPVKVPVPVPAPYPVKVSQKTIFLIFSPILLITTFLIAFSGRSPTPSSSRSSPARPRQGNCSRSR